jgi:hypothetical protein
MGGPVSALGGGGSRLALLLTGYFVEDVVEELGPAAGRTFLPRGSDRGLSLDEVASIRLVEDPAPAAA